MFKIYLTKFSALFIALIVVLFTPSIPITKHPISGSSTLNYVKITVVVDNNPNPSMPVLECVWGLSIYVEAGGIRILFDTGPSPEILIDNMKFLGIDPSTIKYIVISHAHADHYGGLEALAKYSKNVVVYIPDGVGKWFVDYLRNLGFRLRIVRGIEEIAYGVYAIGPLYSPVPEICLAINVKGLGLVILVGCSHPGAHNMVRLARSLLNEKPYSVIGGFHLIGASLETVSSIVDELVDMGVRKIYPIHCSGDLIRKYLAKNYPERYGEGYVGLRMVFGRDC